MNDGNYFGKLVEGVTSTARSGNPQMNLKCLVTHVARSDGQWADVTPFEKTVYLSLSDGAWKYSAAKLKLLGFNGDFGNPVFSDTAFKDGFGLSCRNETYEGKSRERWDLADWGTTAEKAPSDVLAKLSAQWNRDQAPPPPGRPAPTPKQTAAPAAVAAAVVEAPTAESKDVCWKLFVSKSGGKPDLKKWAELVRGLGKAEKDFGEPEWMELRLQIEGIPF